MALRPIIRLIGVRQVNNFFREKGVFLVVHESRVCDDVVHPRGAHRAWKAKIVDLDRGGLQNEYARPFVSRISVQIYQNIYFILSYSIRDFTARKLSRVKKLVDCLRESPTHRAAVIIARGNSEYIEPLSVMTFEQFRDQISGWVVAKLACHVGNAYFAMIVERT